MHQIRSAHIRIRQYFFSNIYGRTLRGLRGVKNSDFFLQIKVLSSCPFGSQNIKNRVFKFELFIFLCGNFYLRKTSSSSIKHLSKKVVFEKFLECTTAMMSRRRAEAQFDERSKHTQLFRPENNFFSPFFPPSSSPRNTDAQ